MVEIRLSKSVIGDEEINAVTSVLKREYLGMGKEVKEFEDILGDYFGRQVVCVVNGTGALQLSVQAAGLRGHEILVQSLTFVATFQAITAAGAIPVPCEIDESNFTIDIYDAERKITEKTKAIMPVHYAGCPGMLDKIYKLAEKYGLRVIEDASHAFGSVFNNKIIGSFGDIACFSFDGIKNITSGEGGLVVTEDENVIKVIKDARLLGVHKDSDKRYIGKRSWEFEVFDQGWRYHMSNLMAAIGIEQFKKFDYFKEKRQSLAHLYTKLLSGIPEVTFLDHNYSEIVPHIFVIRIKNNKRDMLRKELNNSGIETGIHYKPNHLLKLYANQKYNFEKTEMIYNEIITLPLHPDLSDEDVKYVCNKIITLLT